MARARTRIRRIRRTAAVLAAVLAAALPAAAGPAGAAGAAAAQAPAPRPVPSPTVSGPLPGTAPGDPASPAIEDTYPFLSTTADLRAAGYVEQEFTVAGSADAYAATGELLAEDVAYETRLVVRRPARDRHFNGTVLVEWQNVSAGYDLDALWSPEQVMRAGYAWVGVSAQRVGVDQLRGWSPARYGDLDVTGGGRFTADQMSYDIFAQAAQALRRPAGTDPMGPLRVDNVLAVGASQSAGRMTIYYDAVLPQVEEVFDGYGFIVGNAPRRQGGAPVFQVLSETDVRTPDRPADTDTFRRWEVAGAAHSGYAGSAYRAPIVERDLGPQPPPACDRPPLSRVPLHHVVAASYDHLVRWVEDGTPPPTAEPLEFAADGTKARDELGLARGGIRLSQVEVPTALNTGDNGGELFCRLFGTHVPFDEAQLDALYPRHGTYVAGVLQADLAALRAGHLLPADARTNLVDAAHSPIGR